ncbi:MAG TPA: hypothetical protein DF712_14215 [Balneola sp.]|nr:hypothetical protein [Bacteroidota bacterium]MAC05541.1 hypothetical protein [Balneola sp.]MAO76642.1 hypothetical protein [Balneola sp.]MBF65049.1 hypothetical protein [Balneola sp.]HAH52208.1 hypothetical protein [Balneola sp.]
MKADKLLLELEHLLEQCGYRLRKERGSFRGNNCIIEGDMLVIVNKNKPIESQVGTIARILSDVDLSTTYIKPAVKKELNILWDRLALSPHSSGDELDFD